MCEELANVLKIQNDWIKRGITKKKICLVLRGRGTRGDRKFRKSDYIRDTAAAADSCLLFILVDIRKRVREERVDLHNAFSSRSALNAVFRFVSFFEKYAQSGDDGNEHNILS